MSFTTRTEPVSLFDISFVNFTSIFRDTSKSPVNALDKKMVKRYMKTEREEMPRSNPIRYFIANRFSDSLIQMFLLVFAIISALSFGLAFCFMIISFFSYNLWFTSTELFFVSLGSFFSFFLTVNELINAEEGIMVRSRAKWIARSPSNQRVWDDMPPRIQALVSHLIVSGYDDSNIQVHELVQDDVVYDPVISTSSWLGIKRYHAIYVDDQVKEIIDF